MDAPVCRLCGHKHYGLAHVFDKPVKEVANKPVLVANKHGQYADKDKRREYMRVYMQQRRAPHI